MSLSTLTEELHLAVSKKVEEGKEGRKGIKSDLEKIISSRITYPPDWNNSKVEIGYVARRKPGGYYLNLSAFPEITQERMLPLLEALLADSGKKRFKKGAFEIKASVHWPTDLFAEEINFGDATRVDIRGSFYAHDPTKVRIGFQGRSHKLEAKLDDRELTISAGGDYNSLFEPIIREVKPQFATIQFSKADAEILSEYMRRTLKPKRQFYIDIRTMSFGEQEIIEVTAPIKILAKYSEILDKPLIGESDGETFIVNLTKTYLLRRSILSDLKKVVRILSGFKAPAMFGQSLLTVPQAKKLLDKEIDIISRAYENVLYLGMNTHMQRGSPAKRLAEDHFGKKVLEPFDEMEPDQYLAFLKEQGFDYKGELDREHEQGYILKERYLLSFFKQSYENDPSRSVTNFRKWYTNAPPKIRITGSIKSDASRIPRLSLPAYVTLTGFELNERTRKGENEISINRQDDKTIHFWVRVSLDSSGPLLDLQEKACETLGLTFG